MVFAPRGEMRGIYISDGPARCDALANQIADVEKTRAFID